VTTVDTLYPTAEGLESLEHQHRVAYKRLDVAYKRHTRAWTNNRRRLARRTLKTLGECESVWRAAGEQLERYRIRYLVALN
jgi:hypothetical protein